MNIGRGTCESVGAEGWRPKNAGGRKVPTSWQPGRIGSIHEWATNRRHDTAPRDIRAS